MLALRLRARGEMSIPIGAGSLVVAGGALMEPVAQRVSFTIVKG